MTDSTDKLNQVMLSITSLCKVFDLGRSTITERVREFKEWIAKGRYPRTSIIIDGNIVRINRYAFHDFLTNRQALMNSAEKYVEPYNPAMLAMETGYIKIA